MAYFFLDDGALDAEDCANNFIHFDENNSECCLRRMEAVKKLIPFKSKSMGPLRHELAGCTR